MKFSFTSLGTASALPTVNRYPSAHVLNVHERLFLIDCGEGCQIQMRRYGFSFSKIQNIFISHMHGDHVFGIFGLLSTMSLLGRTADLFIYAPISFSKVLSFFIEEFGDGIKYNIIHQVLDTRELSLLIDAKSFEILSFPLNHRVDCYGFLFREKQPALNVHKHLIDKHNLSLTQIAQLKRGEDIIDENGDLLENSLLTYSPYVPRSFAYCSDTAPFAKLKEYISGVDLVYHEATFMDEMVKMARTTGHSTAIQAAGIAKKAGVKRLILGHFSSRYRDLKPLLEEAKSLFPNTELASEGEEFEL